MKKIVSLTKVFIKEFYQNLPIFQKDKNKRNKKSLFFWLVAIVFIAVAYVSYKVIVFLADAGQPEVFLNLYFLILMILLLFQTILVCSNVFFFSKDIEKILHMPLKPVELLLAKLSTLLCMLYASEGILGMVPLTLYGLLTHAPLFFYLGEIIVLIVFPIFIAVIVSTIMLLIMRLGKFVKNKDIFQFIITTVLIMLLLILEFKVISGVFGAKNDEQALQQITSFSQKANQANQYFLIINPSVEILTSSTTTTIMVALLQLLGYSSIGILIFIGLGKRTYLKDILKNMISDSKQRNKKIDSQKDIKKCTIRNSYLQKEIKLLIREPIFFIQCVLPVIAILVTCTMVIVILLPTIQNVMQEEAIQKAIQGLSFNGEVVCDILIVLQVLFSLSTISLTAISREGKNAVLIKYLPVELYKQFVYKNIPQIMLNFLVTVVILGMIYYFVPTINLLYLFLVWLIAMIINAINSYVMLLVDLRRPNLDWDTQYSVVKKSENKVFQYAFMIANILFLMYLARILKNTNILIALLGEFAIYIILFIILDRGIKKWQSKLFDKII